MRQEYIQTTSRTEAKQLAPWACVTAKVLGGYMAFESWVDYQIWRKVKTKTNR